MVNRSGTVAGLLAAVMILVASGLAGCTSSSPAQPAATPPQPAPSTSASVATTATTASAAPEAADWPMYHGTPDRAGHATTMPPVSGTLSLTANLKLDGAVYASPIIVHGMTIVATENDTVYAFDQAYHQVWKISLGTPSPQSERQCGDIDPLGITGTPIYDAGTGHVYVVAEQAGPPHHTLFALSLADGKVAWQRSVDLPGVTAAAMQQRGALAITGGKVWVPFGAQAGDCGDYKGRIVGVPLDGSSGVVSYSPPTQRGGGIWNPAGATIDTDGTLLAVSANGAAFPGDTYDHTNTVLRLNAAAKLVDSFAPSDWAANNQGDVGLGSQGVALVGTQWAVLGGKSGPVYVLHRDKLGGIGGEVSQQNICRSFGGAAVDGTTVYLPCTDGVRAVSVDGSGQLHVLWHADSSINGTPVVGGGVVWALDYSGGVLHALDPQTGRSVGNVTVGQANRFASPAIYGADVIVPTLSGVAVVRTS